MHISNKTCHLFFIAILLLTGCSGGSGGSSYVSGNSTRSDAVVGEEVLFSANDFANLSFLSNPLYAKYEWTINDDTTPVVEGRSITHVFINPGTYQVTLKVTQGVLTNPGTDPGESDDVYTFPAANTRTFVKNIVIGGESRPLPPLVSTNPILELNFENSIADSSPSKQVVEWGSGTSSFVQGVKGKALDVSGGRYIKVKNPSTWLGGLGEFTITFWAKKKDTTKATNVFLSVAGAGGQIINYSIYNNPSNPNDCSYSLQMITSGGSSLTALFTRDVYEDTLWHHYAFTYSGGQAILYLDGRRVVSGLPGGTLSFPNSDLLIGYSAASGAFNGYIDELRIYNKALTAHDLSVGFEVWHADIHARSAQYLYVQIPEKVTSNPSNRLRMTISGGALGNSVIELANKTALQSEEKILLNNSSLNGSQNDYVMTTQLLDSSSAVMYTQSEKFKKTYDGAPVVAIDENNSLRVRGTLFFPVTPWGLDNDLVATWAANGYINTLSAQGFGGGPFNTNGYAEYLNIAIANNVMTIGPSAWEGTGHQTQYSFQKSSDPYAVKNYVTTFAASTGVLMWNWWDEPELNNIPAQALRSLTYIAHQNDDQHPVSVNFAGCTYTSVYGEGICRANRRLPYTYQYSKGFFGIRKPIADVVGIDYYPIDWATNPPTDTMNRLTTALETIRSENYDLLPVMSFVETSDPNPDPTPWAPSAAQLRMLAWLNVVHEVKGISWFHYFPQTSTSAANYLEMARFTRQIRELTPAVLGPRISRTVTIDYAGQTGRIDTMLREYNGKLYLIAVRVSEVAYPPTGNTLPPAQNYSLNNVRFGLGTGIAGTTATVYEESRTITVANGQFSDTFAPYDVHIYLIDE